MFYLVLFISSSIWFCSILLTYRCMRRIDIDNLKSLYYVLFISLYASNEILFTS